MQGGARAAKVGSSSSDLRVRLTAPAPTLPSRQLSSTSKKPSWRNCRKSWRNSMRSRARIWRPWLSPKRNVRCKRASQKLKCIISRVRHLYNATLPSLSRIPDEFATLQHLHATTLESLTPNELVLCFSNQLRLRFKSTNWRALVAGATLELVGDAKSGFRRAGLQLMQEKLKAVGTVDAVPKVRRPQ